MSLCPWIALGGLFLASAGALQAQTHEVARELWDRPRTADVILAHESIKAAVRALLTRADGRLLIHHSPEQDGALHAEEIRSWLTALAIDTRRVLLRGDLPAGAQIRLEVT